MASLEMNPLFGSSRELAARAIEHAVRRGLSQAQVAVLPQDVTVAYRTSVPDVSDTIFGYEHLCITLKGQAAQSADAIKAGLSDICSGPIKLGRQGQNLWRESNVGESRRWSTGREPLEIWLPAALELPSGAEQHLAEAICSHIPKLLAAPCR